MVKFPVKPILFFILVCALSGCAKEAPPAAPTVPAETGQAVPAEAGQAVPAETGQTTFVPITPGFLSIAVSPDLAPMEFVVPSPEGEDTLLLAGFDISLGEYLADALELEVQWLPMGFEGCLSAVENGTADMAISSVAWTAARQERFNLSNPYIPYNGTADVVVMRTGADALTQTVNTVLEQAKQAGCYAQWYSQAKTDALNGVEITFGSDGAALK